MYNYYNPYQYYAPYQQQYAKPIALQGKLIDNIEAVKAVDIPLDGSTSYFPLADGSAIVSKQLKQDGTSRVIVYKPDTEEKQVKYVTEAELDDIKKELENLKRQMPVKEGEPVWTQCN